MITKDRLPTTRKLASNEVYLSRGASLTVDFLSHKSVERNGFFLQYQAGNQFSCFAEQKNK